MDGCISWYISLSFIAVIVYLSYTQRGIMSDSHAIRSRNSALLHANGCAACTRVQRFAFTGFSPPNESYRVCNNMRARKYGPGFIVSDASQSSLNYSFVSRRWISRRFTRAFIVTCAHGDASLHPRYIIAALIASVSLVSIEMTSADFI